MKLIADIRYFESLKENVVGYNPSGIGNIFEINFKDFSPVNHRFVLKLREMNFSLPDFDHIYLNFTTVLDNGKIQLANRPPDKLHPFYCYIDFGFSPDFFNSLPVSQKYVTLINAAVEVICRLYCENEDLQEIVKSCADEILCNGENSIIVYKTKSSADYCVQVAVRILDTLLFLPIIRVYDSNQKLINEYFFDTALSWFEFIFQFGSILIGKTVVTIKPKNNSLSEKYSLSTLKYPIG